MSAGAQSVTRAAAEAAVARTQEVSAELRGCAILNSRGDLLAASGPSERWERAARAFLEAADDAGGERVAHAHVATEDGEAFALRYGELAMVAVASRFALASLALADMRAALRELSAEVDAGHAVTDRGRASASGREAA